MHTSMMMAVNSPPVAHRDPGAAAASYRPYDEYAVIPQRPDRTADDHDRAKKDKKWSFGKLFRRKKKDDGSSESESEEGTSRSHSKRKIKKKNRNPQTVSNFDHIVLRDTRRAHSLVKTNHKDLGDDGILSDPSAGFVNYKHQLPQNVYGLSKESLNADLSTRSARTSSEAPSRKTRKGRLKARVEALRNSLRADTSSDEESIKSSNSSSMIRFRSDDSLMRSRDSSLNKRSRSARNERYIKRLSRDEENQLNKEAELLQQGYTKAEVEMLTRTPTSQSSGYGTCRKDQSAKLQQEHVYANELNRRPFKSDSISSFPSTQSYPSSINFNAKVNNEQINYSIQYPVKANRGPIYNNVIQRSLTDSRYDNSDNVICVKLPLGNVTNIKKGERSPPVPPPRDMHRKVVTPVSMLYENGIASDKQENSRNSMHGVPNNDFERVMRRSQERSINPNIINGLRRPISNSEDHIAMMNNEYLSLNPNNEQLRRPASVSADPKHFIYNSPPWRRRAEPNNIIKPEALPRQDFLYFADQSPRSRRPITIQPSSNNIENQYLSDSQTSLNPGIYKKPRNASDFWRKLDDAERQRKQQNLFVHSRSNSDHYSNSYLSKANLDQGRLVKAKSENPDVLNKNIISSNIASRDVLDGAKAWKATTEYKTPETPKIMSPTTKTHVRHKSDTFISNNYQMPSDDEKNTERRKSTNLDDALNELEAIYNSLGLGDEDLLDRAERRELMSPKSNGNYNDWNGNDEELQLSSQPSPHLRRISRRSTLPDKLQDDMAFRRLNSKEKSSSLKREPQTQISYMLASPVYVPCASDDERQSVRDEPDIVHDDMMYRTVTQTNNRLKTIEPQPPFGIPIGPVSPAPLSDYLHATPENKTRSRFVPRRSPDLVSDDLAYRSLRKDNRHSYCNETFISSNNNQYNNEYPVNKDSPTNIKKKRAIRSLSANIFTMIQKEIDDALHMSKMATLQKTHSSNDVTRRLRESFENRDDDSERLPRNKVKQRHNTVNLLANNHHASNHHFAKDDSYIYKDDKYLAKPPHCDKSKSSSPSNRSPQATKKPSRDEFQQVLSMLAQEAMDTSNKLGVALAELDKNRNQPERKSDVQARITDSRINFLNGLTNKNSSESAEPPPEIKYVNVRSEIVNDTDTINNLSKAQKTEDSLMQISNQLHKVEDQLKHSFEKEIKFNDESLKLKNYLKNTEEQLRAQESTVAIPESNKTHNIVPMPVHNDAIQVHAINNVVDDKRQSKVNNCHQSTEDKIEEINEIKAFKELKDGISDLIAGISHVSEKLCVPKHRPVEQDNNKPAKVGTITEVSAKLDEVDATPRKASPPRRPSINLSIYENDPRKDNADSTEYNSSEELATIFKFENKDKIKSPLVNDEVKENRVRTDLSSPKLVQSANQHLRRLSVDHTEAPSQSSGSLPANVVPWRTKRQNNTPRDHRDNGTEFKNEWHDNPGTLMLTCSYTLLLAQHLADMDWLTLLGLLLAIVTIIAMLLI